MELFSCSSFSGENYVVLIEGDFSESVIIDFMSMIFDCGHIIIDVYVIMFNS